MFFAIFIMLLFPCLRLASRSCRQGHPFIRFRNVFREDEALLQMAKFNTCTAPTRRQVQLRASWPNSRLFFDYAFEAIKATQ